MSDISTENLDNDLDSPLLARPSLLDAVTRVSALSRYIQTADPATLLVTNKLSVIGDVRANSNLHVQGQLSFGNAGTAGYVLTSQGPGLPATWSTVAAGDKYKATSTSNLTIDAVTPKTVVIEPDLSYSTGQSVVVTNNATRYMGGTVQSYDPATGSLVFANEYQLGSGSFSSWTVNIAGKKGTDGTNGTAGSSWYNGTTVPSAGTGVDNDYYINKTNGDYYQKQVGAWVLQGNLTGPSGSGGGGGSSTVYSTTSRYQAITTAGEGVTIVSSASVKTGISWSRVGSTMTIVDPGHNRLSGQRVILRNTNVPVFDTLTLTLTADTFDVTCADTGPTSGTAAAYSMGFTFAYVGPANAKTGGVVSAPPGSDCVLLSIRIHMAANTRATTTWQLTVPKGNVNGAGGQTGLDDMSIPVQQIRQDSIALPAVGNTIACNVGGDWGVYTFGALPAATTGIHILANF